MRFSNVRPSSGLTVENCVHWCCKTTGMAAYRIIVVVGGGLTLRLVSTHCCCILAAASLDLAGSIAFVVHCTFLALAANIS